MIAILNYKEISNMNNIFWWKYRTTRINPKRLCVFVDIFLKIPYMYVHAYICYYRFLQCFFGWHFVRCHDHKAWTPKTKQNVHQSGQCNDDRQKLCWSHNKYCQLQSLKSHYITVPARVCGCVWPYVRTCLSRIDVTNPFRPIATFHTISCNIHVCQY